jgi:D-galactarolactone cycloisomerase
MKIREVRALGLRGGTPEGGWSNELRPDDCVHTLIAVLTDEGLVGWGSVFTSDFLVEASLRVLEPLYAGESAIEPERLQEKLDGNTFWQGRGGAITHAISGIDIALWDILGQVANRPIGSLLGGRYRERVQAYASILMREPEALADELRGWKEAGFRAFKIGWGPFGRVSDELDERIVAAARQAIGPECRLMVDAGGSDALWTNGLKWARRSAEMLANYGVEWFEEPLRPDAMSDYADLRQSSRIAIAGGEVLTRRQSFMPWIAARAFDVVQPDVTKVGGISPERRIAWAAADAGIRFIPHGWNTAIGLAADLQLASAFPDTDLVEYRPGSPYIDDLLTWQLDDDGMLEIPDRAGLGIDLDRTALARFVDPSLLNGLPT